MHPSYPRLFSTIKLGPIEIPNRFYFSPHGVHFTVGSKPSLDYAHYKVARVRDHGQPAATESRRALSGRMSVQFASM